jgi:hypothetical protein
MKKDFAQRNTAVDILRALTMLSMIFVNDFWTVKGVPHWMRHAGTNEDFLGLSDVVFPLFLFVVGMSIPYAIERRFSKGSSDLSTVSHILTRTFALLIMGIFTVNTEYGISRDIGMSRDVFMVLMVAAFLMIWNVYPKTEKPIRHLYTALQVLGILILVYLAFIFRDAKGGILQTRWWGILGAIGWTYLVCGVIYLFVRDKIPRIFFFWLGFILLCMVKNSHLIPGESFLNSLLNIVNIGSGAHVAFTMGGILFSLIIVKYADVATRKKVIFIVSAVAILLITAVISNNFWIISKNRGTLPWVLYCLAIAIGLYGLIQWAVSNGKASWFNIIKPAGTATLTCYLIPYVLYSVIYGFLSLSLPDWMKDGAPGLIKCAGFAFLCIGVTALLERSKIKIKI